MSANTDNAALPVSNIEMKVKNQSKCYIPMQFYIKVYRKILLIFMITLNLVVYGLNVELYRNQYNWRACQIIEIILLFLIAFDIIIMEISLFKMVSFIE